MRRSLTLLVVLVLFAPVVARGTAGVSAQDPADGLFADVRAGTCGADVGDIVAPLTSPIIPTGDQVGAEGAQTAATSFTEVPATLADLVAADHAVSVVRGSAGDAAPVACGEIGGIPADDGSLTIVISEEGDSGANGIAFLAPVAAGGTGVSLFLAVPPTEEGEIDEEPGADGEPDEATEPPAALASGGLGLSREAWEAEHGAAEDDALPTYEDQTYLVIFWEEVVWNLHWNLPEPVSVDEARALSGTVTPVDRALLETITAPSGRPVDVYASASLADRYSTADADPWGGAAPGTFIVIYGTDPTVPGSPVESILTATGNNP